MKRDMELIRAILLHLENGEGSSLPKQYTEEVVAYHIGLCIEANLVHGKIMEDQDGDICGAAMWRLTWEGHEFLDAARNTGVWDKVMATIKAEAAAVPFTILKALLFKMLKEKTGLEIGL